MLEVSNYELHHIATGGTIDSHFDPSKDHPVPNDASIVPEYLKNVRLPRHRVTSETVFLRDSRELSRPEEQGSIAARVSESTHKRILLTIGTWLMPVIGVAISQHPPSQNLEDIDKKVVLSGSLIPMRDYTMSDAGFNLGLSTAILQQGKIASRVMLVMNGKCFSVGNDVKKDPSKATFYSSDGRADILGYERFLLIPAGGSMDLVPDGLDRLALAKESLIPQYLREHVKLERLFDSTKPALKDHGELKDKDLDGILDIIRTSTAEKVLITLGIHNMRKVRKFLKNHLSGSDTDKSVVLTGSRMPLNAEFTDASFNLGYALGVIGFLRRGVHVAMNGILFGKKDDILKTIYTDEEREQLKKMGMTG